MRTTTFTSRPSARAASGTSLVKQLLLERLRRRRDDDALARGERRDQVGEALARARAGLREQVLARGERVGDGGRQLGLLGTRLEAVENGGQPPALFEDARGEDVLA